MSLAIILGICSALALQIPSLGGAQALLRSELAQQEAQTSSGGTATSQTEEKTSEGAKSEKKEGAKAEPQAGSASQDKPATETSKPESSTGSGKKEEPGPDSQAATPESSGSTESGAARSESGQEEKTAKTSQSEKKTKKKGQKQSSEKTPSEQDTTPGQEGTPGKVVVRNGGATDPPDQIAPTMTEQQASTQIENTNSLLSTTDENLKKISGKQLDTNQQDMLKQARKYVEQAKAAAETGDLVRAKNLALKAQLLSEELVKH